MHISSYDDKYSVVFVENYLSSFQNVLKQSNQCPSDFVFIEMFTLQHLVQFRYQLHAYFFSSLDHIRQDTWIDAVVATFLH